MTPDDILQAQTTIQLVDHNGTLYFPFGIYEKDVPSMLIYQYDAGDCDTCKWPMGCPKEASYGYDLDKQRRILAGALYGERECNPHFPWDATILLPDGSVFDLDQYVS
jgi:hypothetical protein